MTNDFRVLCAELADALDHNRQCLMDDRSLTHPLADRARAALAVEAVGPSDEDLMDMAEFYIEDNGLLGLHNAGDFARAVLARYGSAPRPVPVSERLPGPEDCNTEGRCWWCDSIQWRWDFLIADNRKPSAYDHWLPAHAIPLPQENTDG